MPNTPSGQRSRTAFEEVPELYERARPSYPEEVFDDLVALAQLPEDAHIVEIGCGTGQATLPLAQRGFRITCVELGEQLAAAARRKLTRFPAVEIVNADFETWQPIGAKFDAAVAFTAFHWIAADVRYQKSAGLLCKGGALGVVAADHVLPDDGDPFFVEVEEDYHAVIPDKQPWFAPRPEAIGDLSSEIEASGVFANLAVRRYLWDVTYAADEYVAVLDTYSDHRALDEDTRQRLYQRIHRRIEARPERSVRKTYLATLNVAKRL